MKEKPLGSPKEALGIVLKMAEKGVKIYGIPWEKAFTTALRWANRCQACGYIIDINRYYARKKSLGLCVDCGGPVIPGKVRCEECSERQRKQYREHRQRKLAAMAH
ncbi:MAG: hypothetical protein ACPL5F_01575 [Moorellaceae bacterium]